MQAVMDQSNYESFRDCVSGPIVQKLLITSSKPVGRKAARGRKKSGTQSGTADPLADVKDDAEDLTEFVEYIAMETFSSLPQDLQTLSYQATQDDPRLAEKYTDPISPTTLDPIVTTIPLAIPDSLVTYALIPDPSFLPNFLASLLNPYISSVTTPPPSWSSTRASACEICDRSWINLTYHHLIPRQMHAKVIKRGWHEEWKLNSVAWLCGACHRFVHRIASNEELAKDWWSVERLLEREDVRAWAEWVGRVRWKAK